MVVTKKTHGGGLAGLTSRLQSLTKVAVYVGIPAGKASRTDGEINNAELLYIHTNGVRSRKMRNEMNANIGKGLSYNEAHSLYIQEHGSPLMDIPARPVIEPALKANKDKIMAEYSKAVSAAAEGNDGELMSALTRTGLAGENAARDWFTDPRNEWEPNSPKTIARKGSSRPLIDTSALRKAITHVVRHG